MARRLRFWPSALKHGLLALVLLVAAAAVAQTDAITLQVTDGDGQTWNNGTWQLNGLIPAQSAPGFPFYIAGTASPVPNQSQSGSLSGTGGATFSVTPNASIAPAGSTWSLTVCPQATSACQTVGFTATGSTQTVNVNPAAIRINLTGIPYRVLAYQDLEVTNGPIGSLYYNLSSASWRTCTQSVCSGGSGWTGITGSSLPSASAQGEIPVSVGVGTVYAAQVKQVIDARDLSGVDCTGSTDSSTALNALTVVNGITNRILSFAGCAKIMLANQWLIKGQSNALIDFGGIFASGSNQGSYTPGGVDIFGCPTSNQTDAMIRIDDTGFSAFRGGMFEAQEAGCSYSFQGSIRMTNSQTGGYTSSRNRFDDMWLTTSYNGTQIGNYYGFKIDGSPNQEGMGFHHVLINCNNSSGSYGLWLNDVNADSTRFDDQGEIEGCYYGARLDAGTLSIDSVHLTMNGNYSVFGSGGAAIYVGPGASGGCLREAEYVANDTSGAFLAGGSSPNCRTFIANSNISFPYIDPALYPIMACYGSFTLAQNQLNNAGAAVTIHNNTVIGCDTDGSNGPTAEIYDLGGNNVVDSGNSGAFNFTLQPFDTYASYLSGETHLGRSTNISNNPANNGADVAGGSSNDWALFPPGGPSSSGQSWPSGRLIFARGLYNATAPVFDQFTFKSVGDYHNATATLAEAYKNASGYSITPYLAVQPTVSGMTFGQAATPSWDPIHSNVTNVGTTGSTTYSYVFVALGGCGSSAASSTGTTTTGNATLSSINYNTLHMDATAGAWGFNIYRTVGGSTQGKIGQVLATDYEPGGTSYLQFNDTGLSGDGTTAPSSNTSGCISLSNLTAATSSVSQPSLILNFPGQYWTGSASAADNWAVQDVVGNGTNGSSALTFTHTGTSGSTYLSVPEIVASNLEGSGAVLLGPSVPTSGTFGIIVSAGYQAMASGWAIRWTNGSNYNNTADTGLSRIAAGVLGIGNGTAGDTTSAVKAAAYMAVGTTFTSSGGCSETTLTGGATKGSFNAGAASCTTTITMGNSATAPNGWACSVWDVTTTTDTMKETASAATTVTFSGTVVSGDKIIFSCDGF